jgi:thioredoxin-related protein
MNRIILTFLLLIVGTTTFAQAEGIHFEHNTTWKEVLAKAKAEHKYIMVDCYTTWCGPCKMMSKQVFPQKEVGEFYNKNFINVKIQLDTTAKDNKEIKSWYADANQIATVAKVDAYPTILYFNPEGKLVHRTVGFNNAEGFLMSGEDAMNPEKQYITLVEKYKLNPNDTLVVQNLALRANEIRDEPLATELSAKYLTINKTLTPGQVNFLLNFTSSSSAPGFQLAQKYPSEIDAVAGKGSASQLLNKIILTEELSPYLEGNGNDLSKINWETVKAKLKSKYPAYADGVMREGKLLVFNMETNTRHKITIAKEMIKEFKDKISAEEYAEMLQSFAIGGMISNDKELLQCALRWSTDALKYKYQDYKKNLSNRFVNAIILYNMGQKQKAIAMQTETLSLMPKADEDYPEIVSLLNKMKKGVKNLFED